MGEGKMKKNSREHCNDGLFGFFGNALVVRVKDWFSGTEASAEQEPKWRREKGKHCNDGPLQVAWK